MATLGSPESFDVVNNRTRMRSLFEPAWKVYMISIHKIEYANSARNHQDLADERRRPWQFYSQLMFSRTEVIPSIDKYRPMQSTGAWRFWEKLAEVLRESFITGGDLQLAFRGANT